MRILLLSDLHFGKASVGGFSNDQISRAKKHGSYDVLIFCGDLAESIPHFQEGLNAMRSIDAAHRLFVAGNNDIERLEGGDSRLNKYADDLQDLIGGDFHLLDRAPKEIKGVNFAGNVLNFDGSLWKGREEPGYLGREEVNEKVNHYWNGKPYHNIRYTEFAAERLKDLHRHTEGKGSSSIVVTHFVPHPDFVLYGENPKFDYLNFFMGQDLTEKYPHCRIGFCGHTHRRKSVFVDQQWVENVSTPFKDPQDPVWYKIGL